MAVVPEDLTIDENSSVLFLMHGYGSHMGDLASLSGLIRHGSDLMICPNAPFPLQLGFNQSGFSWGNYEDQENYTDHINESSERAFATIEAAKDQYGVDDSNLIVGGFSQGGSMALRIGFTQDRKFKGVLALSTILREDHKDSIQRSDVPTFVSHGTNDQVLDIKEGRYINETLKTLNIDVTYKEYAMAHEITRDCISDLSSWIDNLGVS